MQVINNIKGRGTEDIAVTLQQILESRSGSHSDLYPLIYIIKELNEKKDGNPVYEEAYGLAKIPIHIYNEHWKADNVAYIEMSKNRFFLRKGEGQFVETEGNISIPIGAKVIDTEQYILGLGIGNFKHSSESPTLDCFVKVLSILAGKIPNGENVVHMYVGNEAYNCVSKSGNFDTITFAQINGANKAEILRQSRHM